MELAPCAEIGLIWVRTAGDSAVYSAPSMSILPKTRALRGTCLFSSHDRLTVGTMLALSRVSEEMRAWMVKGSEISGFGGGSLEHPRQWLAIASVSFCVPSCPTPPGASCGGA